MKILHEEKPQTHGDEMRAMSDEQLIEWIMKNTDDTCSFCLPKMRTEKKCDGHCRAGILNYLRSEAT